MLHRLVSRCRRAAVKPFALLAALIPVAGGGVLAYNFFFARPGESAIQLLPQDALVVVTLDVTPSPEQASTFKRIQEAVEREGLMTHLDQAMTEAMDKSPALAELRPHLSDSFAMAALPRAAGAAEDAEPEMAVLLAVKDDKKALETLGKHGTKRSESGLDVWAIEKPKAEAALIGPYLVLAQKAEVLGRIRAVEQKKAPPLEKLPDYQQARASLPPDANLMVFVSPAGMKELQRSVSETAGLKAPESRFFTLGMTVRDAGLEITGQMPTLEKDGSPFRRLADVPAIDPAVLGRLPSGAYGVFVLSQPSGLWAPLREALEVSGEGDHSPPPPAVELKPTEVPASPDPAPADESDEAAGEAEEGEVGEEREHAEPPGAEPGEPAPSPVVEDALAEFERETGLSVEKDVVPALGGHLAVAVYPDATKGAEGWDVLLLLDDARGADPARLAEKLRLKLREEGGPRLVQEELRGRKVWVAAEPIEGKTACFAEAGKAVLLSSSRELIDRALEGWDATGGGLGAQASFTGMQKALLPGAQVALMVDVRALLEAFRKPLEEGMGEMAGQDLTFDDVAGLFGAKDGGVGLTLSAKYDGQIAGFQLFLPVDYDRAIRVMAVGARRAGEGAGPAKAPAEGADPKWEFTH